MSLFNQSILAERGFDRGVFLTITTVAPLIGLAANLRGRVAGDARVGSGALLAGGLLDARRRPWPAFPLVSDARGRCTPTPRRWASPAAC